MKFIFRIFKVILPMVVLTLLIPGCSSDGFTLGGKYLDSNIRTVLIDTCTIKLSTIEIDSVATSGNSLGLVGQYTDPYWGKVKATTFVSYSAPVAEEFSYDVTFDSVGLIMTLNGTYVGDTTISHDINVYPLEETIEIPEKGSYYNTWSIPYSSTPIASYSLLPRPHTKNRATMDPLSPSLTNHFFIRLPDAIGLDLFEKIQNNDPVIKNVDVFREYFKGFAISAGSNNSAVLGFGIDPDTGDADSLLAMRIYYHYSTFQRIKKTIDIPVDASRYFFGVTHDRSGTPFEKLNGTTKELRTGLSGNMGLVQALTATYVKVEFPYLNNLLALGDFGAVVDAILLLYPVKNSYSDELQLPKSLSIYVSDENEVALSAITTYSGDALQNGNLVQDKMFNNDTYYTYDITSYLQDQLGAYGIYKRNLQIIVPQDSMSVTLNTMTFGDQKFSKEGTRLIVKYLIYGNE